MFVVRQFFIMNYERMFTTIPHSLGDILSRQRGKEKRREREKARRKIKIVHMISFTQKLLWQKMQTLKCRMEKK